MNNRFHTKEHAAGFFIRNPSRAVIIGDQQHSIDYFKAMKKMDEDAFEFKVNTAPQWIKSLYSAAEVEMECGVRVGHPDQWRQ